MSIRLQRVACVVLASLWAQQSLADDLIQCAPLFPGGVIPKPKSEHIQDLCKLVDGEPIFAVRFDTQRKVAVWTAHRLTYDQYQIIQDNPAYPSRKNFFTPDSALRVDDQSQIDNYKYTGYDKGHMVRAQDLNWNKEAYRTSYVMTNMAPQAANLNQGVWRGLEDSFQDWVKDKHTTLWAFSGTYGSDKTSPTLKQKQGNATVPACFYKIIVAQDQTGLKALAALFPNDVPSKKRKIWPKYLSSLDLIEHRTGLEFLKGLEVEDNFDSVFWGKNMPKRPADCR